MLPIGGVTVVSSGGVRVHKILIVDDDKAARDLLRACLSEAYEVIDTEDPEQALGLALEHKPDAILLDLSYTSMIPIFVITGESDAKYKDHCANLGAVAYFEKPLELEQLKRRLAAELQSKRSEHRAHVRVRMRLALRLRGTDASGKAFEEMTTTENVSADGFMCNCMSSLVKDAIVEVILSSGGEHYVGRARVVRKESSGTPWQRYGFQFREKTSPGPYRKVSLRTEPQQIGIRCHRHQSAFFTRAAHLRIHPVNEEIEPHTD
jgi:response regulator RpfG family c-di-GMP phosphodiesterase